MGKLPRNQRVELASTILNSLINYTNIKWTFFEDLISSKKLNLHELVLDRGEIILDRDDFLERFSHKIKGRKPEKMYEALIGDRVKELVMIKMVMQNTENYILKVGERSNREIEPNPILLELGDKIADVISSSVQSFGYGGAYGGNIKASALNPRAFPPCVKNVMEGIKSGEK